MLYRIFFSIVFLSLCPYGYCEKESFPFVAEINKDKVNVRAGESANFEKLCQLSKGTQVLVVQRSFSWYKIRLPKIAKSFISEKYISDLDGSTGEITAKAVNIRAGSDVNSSIIGQLNTGDRIKILEKLPGWYKIEPSQQSFGWVSDEFVIFKSKNISDYADNTVAIAVPEIVSVKTAGGSKGKIDTMTGIIQANGDVYQMTVNNQPAYILEGLSKEAFERFNEYDVSIEGTAQTLNPEPPQMVLPIFMVNKIQLVF